MSGTAKPKFELIDDITPAATQTAASQPAPDSENKTASRILHIALVSLSHRFATALTNGFSLFLVSLVFVLFGRVLDEPNPYKLGAVGGFAVFCLLIDIVRRRTK